MNRLTPVEALRAQILLDEALGRLEFLTELTTSANAHQSELSQFMADEIGRIIQQQGDLEHAYEELIAERENLKGLTKKKQHNEVQDRVKDVSAKLRESNKTLCRNLKETPNPLSNLRKMQEQRARVLEMLKECRGDLLTTLSFNALHTKVEKEKADQKLLEEVKKREKETVQQVKVLEQELKREYAEHEKESKIADQEIALLKDELQTSKTQTALKLAFEESQLKAKEAALLRSCVQQEKGLEERMQRDAQGKVREEVGSGSAVSYLQLRTQQLNDEKQKWQDLLDKDVGELDRRATKLQEDRGMTLRTLEQLEEKQKRELAIRTAQEDAERAKKFLSTKRMEQESLMQMATLLLQEEGRHYMARVAERNAAKKGKKGKKGKKK